MRFRLAPRGQASSSLKIPGGSQDGKGGDPSVAGMNKMLNTLLTAAGVTKAGGAPTDNFGDPSLPPGIFSELLA